MIYVPGVGPKDAKIVILGEAPGAAEIASGRPFVGPSGKLLGALLGQAGILMSDCYITNVIKEQPKPTNQDIHKFIDLRRKKAIVHPEGDHWLDILKSELKDLNPNVIVPTGNIGLFALTGKRGITNWRGSVLEQEVTGRKIIPTIHPAASLKGQYVLRYYILNDLNRVAHHSTFPEIPLDGRTYIIRPSYLQCMEFLKHCQTKELVAYDIEVARGEVSCISFAYSNASVISIPFQYGNKEYFYMEQEEALWLEIAKILENPKIRILGHNLTFDSTFLYRKYGIRTQGPMEDTMIAQGLLHPDFRKGLAYVTSWYTSIPYYKDEGKANFKSQDSDIFWKYNAKDSIVLMEAFPKMVKELKQRGLWETYRSQCDLINPLIYMTEKGIRVDKDQLKRSSKELESEIDELDFLIAQEAEMPLNPRSSKQLIDYFYNEKGYPPYKNRKTGRPTVDEKALKRLSRKGSKIADWVLRVREIQKLKSTYLDVKLGSDSRLRGSYNPIGTKTLRLSSSADIFGVGTNLQNLPPAMKKNLQPDQGFIGFEVDLAQAENRVVAYIGPDAKMIQAFETGADIHSQTAGYLFGKDPTEIKRLNKEFEEGGKKPDPRYCPDIGHGNKPFRYWGKEANHAFNYGLGFRNAALRWEIPEKDAKTLHDSYHRIYPGVQGMHRWIKASLTKTRTVSNLFGYKRQFLDHWDEILKDAYAFVAQSTIAELINRRGVKYIYYRHDLFPNVVLLNQVHDSVVFEIPLSASWKTISRYLMLIRASLETPLEFRGQAFSIPANFTLYSHNFSEGVELSDLKPDTIHEAYNSQQVFVQ